MINFQAKCPATASTLTILQACQDPKFCLKYDDVTQTFSLKENHQYYSQVQHQLLVSRRRYCDFFVWTTVDFVVIRILRNETFISDMLPKLEHVYITGNNSI